MLVRMPIKRIIATLISALVLGFIIFNFESWLEWKGLDTVFIDAETSVSEMSLPIWSQINAFIVSNFMTGFALAALVFGFWDWISRQLLALWRILKPSNRVRHAPKPIPVIEVTTPTLNWFIPVI